MKERSLSRRLRLAGWFLVGLALPIVLALVLLTRRPHAPTVVLPSLGISVPTRATRVDIGRWPLGALNPVARLPLGSRPYLLNLWAPWCGPCREEWPLLQRLSLRLSRRGVETVGLAVATTAAAARRFLVHHPSRYPIFLYRGKLAHLAHTLGITAQGVPDSVLIDAHGRIRLVLTGELRPQDIPRILAAAAERP